MARLSKLQCGFGDQELGDGDVCNSSVSTPILVSNLDPAAILSVLLSTSDTTDPQFPFAHALPRTLSRADGPDNLFVMRNDAHAPSFGIF